MLREKLMKEKQNRQVLMSADEKIRYLKEVAEKQKENDKKKKEDQVERERIDKLKREREEKIRKEKLT